MNISNYLFFLRQFFSNKKTLEIYQKINKDNLIVPNSELEDEIFDQEEKNAFYEKIKSQNKIPDFISINDQIYPDCLKKTFNPPVVLYYLGDLSLLKKKKITVVGGRNFDRYADQIIEKLAVKLIKDDFVVVSGLAKGVDSNIQRKIIDLGGKVISVLGNGNDVFYPYENRKLQDEISREHLLLSEYEPFKRPRQFQFVERNRILAGLSGATIIVQAMEKSGTLITAEYALNENREVLTFPGEIFNDNFVGNNYLISQGAIPILDFSEF